MYLNIIWTDRFLKVTCCVSFFFKLYPAYYSQEKRDVVSFYIALLSCARGSRKVEERITAFYLVGNKEHVSSN